MDFTYTLGKYFINILDSGCLQIEKIRHNSVILNDDKFDELHRAMWPFKSFYFPTDQCFYREKYRAKTRRKDPLVGHILSSVQVAINKL